MATQQPLQSRIAKWDNTKAFLILMVVLGHAISPFFSNGPAMKWVDFWINSFHMPLFVFIGGLFSKRTINTVPFKFEKIISFFLLSFYMKVLIYFSLLFSRGYASFSLINDKGVSWYIFAMAIHLTITHVLRNCQPWKVLLASTLLALGVGYIGEIGDILTLSRIIVFFPIFYLGYALNTDSILKVVNKPAVRIGSVLFLIAFSIFTYLYTDEVYSLRYLFTGNNPYTEFEGIRYPLGAFMRIAAYAVSFTVGFAILSIMPNKKLPLISFCGTRTLQVYALHRPVQYILEFTFLREILDGVIPRYSLPILFGISLVMTIVLSLKPFEYVLYPCTNWQKWLGPVINWFKKKEVKSAD